MEGISIREPGLFLKGWFLSQSVTKDRAKPDTVKYFGLGLGTRAIFSGRNTISIHNEKGELVAYCGRAVNSYQIKRTGKYKLPENFVKYAVVYNTNRQIKKEDIYIPAESFLIETADPGYLGSQDTYYAGNLKGVGRIILNIFFKYKRTWEF
jgi:hypothetical protein